MEYKPCILFTAFEPSGDEHAAPVIRELRTMLPDVPIHALGGPKMREAGAELIAETTGDAAMLGGAVAKIMEHHRLRRRLKGWMEEHRIAVHVPTDSPAANWGICKMVKSGPGPARTSARLPKVVHLVAPQVWAWASWRVRRLKRWSDLVLCILPFEPGWFTKHGVAAKFIGHPLFDEPGSAGVLTRTNDSGESERLGTAALPAGHPKLAVLPGSRPGEISANWPLMVEVVGRVLERLPGMKASVAAVDEAAAVQVIGPSGSLPACVEVVVGRTDSVLAWADVVLTASGTATLHVARHGKPMVIVYGVNRWSWNLIGRWLMRTRSFTLPNLIAAGGPTTSTDGHIVREFVPFTGGPGNVQPIVEELVSLIEDTAKRQAQIAALGRVVEQFKGHRGGHEAAEAIAQVYRS